MNFDNIWCWLIPLLTGLICGIIGYFWGKGKREVVDNTAALKALEDKNNKLQADLDACNKKLVAIPKSKPSTSSSIAASAVTAVAFDAAAAKAAFGKKIKQDDLKIVEGIGPKIEGLFHDFDIKTWQALSDSTVAKCQEVLDSGGERYRIHDPASWPLQAKMAFKGEWKNLAKWQDEHKAGKL
ncbi:hypothetical protein MTsPCn5_20980 [Croceitalea sp. MTPC5]|uniref:hypothetical protein n=1 Tax=Croceitalea sp. MTPC5 TaxID=3056565 RepID=UPI002B399E72|nr:hypothetical protein MTsPCn5_20980 [Croceitalea sp. MTPC5]